MAEVDIHLAGSDCRGSEAKSISASRRSRTMNQWSCCHSKSVGTDGTCKDGMMTLFVQCALGWPRRRWHRAGRAVRFTQRLVD